MSIAPQETAWIASIMSGPFSVIQSSPVVQAPGCSPSLPAWCFLPLRIFLASVGYAFNRCFFFYSKQACLLPKCVSCGNSLLVGGSTTR